MNNIKKWLHNPCIIGILFACWLALTFKTTGFIWRAIETLFPHIIPGSIEAIITVLSIIILSLMAIAFFGVLVAAYTNNKFSFISNILIGSIGVILYITAINLYDILIGTQSAGWEKPWAMFFSLILGTIGIIICPILLFCGQKLYFGLKNRVK